MCVYIKLYTSFVFSFIYSIEHELINLLFISLIIIIYFYINPYNFT